MLQHLDLQPMYELITYIPFLTTAFSALFVAKLARHYFQRKKSHYVLWWLFGVLFYGLGTLVESIFTLQGWSEPIFKAWYILGALLGGAPLAQGTVHLLMKPKTAKKMSRILIFVIVVSAILVIIAPIDYSIAPTEKLTGKVLGWYWVRLITPFINVYAFIFLVGGAIWSARKYYTEQKLKRYIGNIYIGMGGLLPGIGGSFSKAGYTEVLYVTEFLGLLLIYIGYTIIKNDANPHYVKPIDIEKGG